MILKLINTADGSHTIYLPEIDEQYHSVNGAITESDFVYIANGFNCYEGNSPIIFEVGFGTGLNCLLTALKSESLGKITIYYSVEKFPLEQILIDQLNYGRLISEEAEQIFEKIHNCKWNETVKISDHFFLKKINKDLTSLDFNSLENFNIIYFDAFGPDKQPEMWSFAIFKEIYNRTLDNGVFVTYSAKGVVRRNLAACGFNMERLPGPPGKKQMLRGIKRITHS